MGHLQTLGSRLKKVRFTPETRHWAAGTDLSKCSKILPRGPANLLKHLVGEREQEILIRSAFAVLRFITSSNFVGRSTGNVLTYPKTFRARQIAARSVRRISDVLRARPVPAIGA